MIENLAWFACGGVFFLAAGYAWFVWYFSRQQP